MTIEDYKKKKLEEVKKSLGATRDFEPMFPSSFSGALKTLDDNTAKPIRYATNEAIKTGKPWEFFKGLAKGYTEEIPDVSGKEIAGNLGLSQEEFGADPTKPLRYSGSGISESPFKTSKAGMVGFVLENLLDAENLIPAGKAMAVGGLALGGLKKVGKDLGESTGEILTKKFSKIEDVFGDGTKINYRNPETGEFIQVNKLNNPIIKDYVVAGKNDNFFEKKFNSVDDALKSFNRTQKADKYKNIPKEFNGQSRVIAKKLIDAGIPVERFKNSAKSDSKYMQVGDLKVRVSDHELPWQYPQSDLEYFKGQNIDEFIKKVKQNYDEYQSLDDDAKSYFSEAKKLGIDRDISQSTQPLTNNLGRPVHPTAEGQENFKMSPKDPNILKGLAPVGPWMLYQQQKGEE